MKRDLYLEDLAAFLPAMTGPQILRNYFDGKLHDMRRALRRHEAQGLITISTELLRARQNAGTPIIAIKHGEPLPTVRELAAAARGRWLDVNKPILVVRATTMLSILANGKPHTAARLSVSHDIALADVFFSKRNNPQFTWQLTHACPGHGALPDAVSAEGAIEVLGQYNGAALAAKLTIAGRMNLELW